MAATSAPSPSQSATVPTPSPAATAELSEIQKKFELAPEIEGLTKEIQEKDDIEKVIYLYNADNPYGGAEGEYAGEYKKEVTEQNPNTGEVKEVGGVVLNPDVVLFKLDKMYEALDPIYVHDRPLYINAMMIPLDISTMSEDNIQVSYIPTHVEGSNTGIVVINFRGPLSVVCPGKGANDYYVMREPDSEWFRLLSQYHSQYNLTGEGETYYSDFVETQTKYIDLIGDFILDEDDEIIEDISFGQTMVHVESYLKFGFFRNAYSDYITENMIRVNECLVFMRAGD